MNVTLRGLTRDDIPAWNRLLAAVEAEDRTGEHYNEADLHEEMDNPDLVPGEDMVGAFAGEELVGYYCVYARSATGEMQKVGLEGSVHPVWRGQGIGTRLAEAMLARGRRAHQQSHPEVPALYHCYGRTDNDSQAALMAQVGLKPDRWNFVMRARLDALPAPLPLPDGLVLRRYDASLDGAMREAHNAAFVDHPNFTPWSASMWRQWVSQSRNFRPELSWLAVEETAPERVVGYVQSNEYDAYFQATGRREAYVGKVGTRREHRGRGVAGALLGHCLAEYAKAGYDEAALDVDADNPTGALGVYERAGFAPELRMTDYALREG